MAEEVKFSKLKAYLESLPENTPDTPYEIKIINYNQETLARLAKVIYLSQKYVDLSSTVLDGITNLQNGFMVKNSKGEFEYSCYRLVAAPKFVNCSATDASYLFFRCGSNLKTVDTSGFVNVTNAEEMFALCDGLTSIDTSVFTNVTNAGGMFARCTGLTSIDTSVFTNVKHANGMFSGLAGLTSIDTSAFTNVTHANGMFESCTGLTSIDTSAFKNVITAQQMFFDCTGLTSIDTSAFTSVKNARGMFEKCKGLTHLEISNFKNVICIIGIIADCNNLDEETKTAKDELLKKLPPQNLELALSCCRNY